MPLANLMTLIALLTLAVYAANPSAVDPRLQNAPWHTVSGKHYGVPYQWGPNVLMYNTDAFKDAPPTSWNVVFEEMTLPDGSVILVEIEAGRITPRLQLEVTVHRDRYDETGLKEKIDAYDQRRHALMPVRKQRYAKRYPDVEFNGWSEDGVDVTPFELL